MVFFEYYLWGILLFLNRTQKLVQTSTNSDCAISHTPDIHSLSGVPDDDNIPDGAQQNFMVTRVTSG